MVLRIRDSVYSGRLRAIISKKAAFYVQIVNSERTFEGLAWAFGNPWLSQSCFQEFSSRTKWGQSTCDGSELLMNASPAQFSLVGCCLWYFVGVTPPTGGTFKTSTLLSESREEPEWMFQHRDPDTTTLCPKTQSPATLDALRKRNLRKTWEPHHDQRLGRISIVWVTRLAKSCVVIFLRR